MSRARQNNEQSPDEVREGEMRGFGWTVYPAEGRLWVLIPLRTKPGLNAREHWAARAKRVKRERGAVRLCWPKTVRGKPLNIPLPCQVRLTRQSPRLADSDQVVGALKAVRDEVAGLLGCGDAPSDPITWDYDQRKGGWGVEVRVCWDPSPEMAPTKDGQ